MFSENINSLESSHILLMLWDKKQGTNDKRSSVNTNDIIIHRSINRGKQD